MKDKIYFSLDRKDREGFETVFPHIELPFENSIEEITGENVLEKSDNLISFIERCYKYLKPGGKAIFTAPYYTSFLAWADPRNIRALSQASLNFASKSWREQNGCPDVATCDFEVACDFAIDMVATQRSEDAKQFWLNRYNNVVQSIKFTLTKKEST